MQSAFSTRTGVNRRRVRRPATVVLSIFTTVMLVLSACGGGDTGSPGGTSAPGGEGSTLTAAVGNTGTHQWAPWLAGDDTLAMYKFMHDSLTDIDKDTGEVIPMLAESWSLSPDGKTWDFKLRNDVKFQEGWGPLTANDVKYTWEQWIREDSNQNDAEQLRAIIGDDLNNIEVVSDTEFKIHTPEPYTTLDSFLAQPFARLYISSQKYLTDKPQDALTHPIGSGPWTFVSSQPGVEVVMKKNPDYWRTVPSFDNLVVKEISDPAARLVQVQSGTVDIANVSSALTTEAKNAGLKTISVPSIATVQVVLGGMYYGSPKLDGNAPWIQADNPEKGLAIRQALSMAIDRQLIREKVLAGEGEVNFGPLLQYNNNPNTMDPNWTLPPFDKEGAKRKLAEGGYPDGFPITLFEYPDDVDTVGIAQAIAGMWKDIGIDVTEQLSEEGVLDEKLNATDTTGLAFVKQQGNDPPPVVLLNYLSTEEDDHKLFYPAIDEGYKKITTEVDPEKRWQDVRDIVTALRNDVVLIPLFDADLPFVVSSRVGDWTPTPGDKDMNSLETVTPAQ
jgi:peptide/nickel transport system substrate-binding protein